MAPRDVEVAVVVTGVDSALRELERLHGALRGLSQEMQMVVSQVNFSHEIASQLQAIEELRQRVEKAVPRRAAPRKAAPAKGAVPAKAPAVRKRVR